MYRPSRLFVLFVLCALAVVGGGCDLFGSDGGKEEDSSPPEGPAIVAAMQGSEPALWLFDAETLERTAILETENRAPHGLAFSPDYNRWYLTWDVGSIPDGDRRNVRAILDPTSGEITKRVATSDLSIEVGPLLYEPLNDHVVGYENSLEFFDPETLELVREQTVGDSSDVVVDAVAADERGKLYVGAVTKDKTGIYVYDPADQEISSLIPLPSLSDIALSPGGRYLYATSWEDVGNRPGRFHVVDLKTGETVFEGGPVGKAANLAVSPGGRYVYIDCPAGGPGPGTPITPTEKVYRFDVGARELNVLIDGSELSNEVTGGHGLIADKITMLPGGEAFVILNRAVLIDYRPGVEEVFPPLLKGDAETGEVLATYTLPRDDEGYVRAEVRQLRFGIVPK